MDQYIIKGGKALAGEISVSGAKNAALGILAAAVMADETVTVENLPDIRDIDILLNAIASVGAVVERIDKHCVRINGGTVNTIIVANDNIRKIRGSYYLLVLLPGGCDIGSRPIDQHIKGFEALGATVRIQHGMIEAEAVDLVGNHIYLDMASVGATINIMMAAVMAEGQTIIENSAKEPHVVDVANFLNSMGANIKGAGTDVIRIVGVPKLHGSTYSIIPDQIEAGTFMIAAAATKGDVTVRNVIPRHMEALTAKLVELGAEVEEFDDAIRVVATKRLGSTQIKTLPYPGFPTDMQPQMTALLAVCAGTSIITEGIYENRFKYVDELARMGTNIKVEGNNAIVNGVAELTGASVVAPDLRAGAALVIAGLVAEGFTTIEQIRYVERGYECFEKKMRDLGADMEKMDSEDMKAVQKFKLKVG